MSNPFEVPRTDGRGGRPTGRSGDFDLALAFRDGADATSRSFLPWLAVMVLSVISITVSFLMCFLPALIVAPVILWGSLKFYLEALDGEGQVGTLFGGFDKLGEIVPTMLGMLVLMGLISAPGFIAGQILSFVSMFTDDVAVGLLASLLGMMVQLVWNVVVGSRFLPVMYLVVEGGLGPLEAVTESWNLTTNCWGKLMAFYLASSVVVFAGVLLCFVGVIPAAMVATGAQASVYRQLVGRRS
jgi:hypothetical protein